MARFQLHCLHSVIFCNITQCFKLYDSKEIQQPEPTIIANSQAVWDHFGVGMLMLELLFVQTKSICFSMPYDFHVENASWITCMQQRYSNQHTIKIWRYFWIQPTQVLAVLHRGLRWYLIHWCFLWSSLKSSDEMQCIISIITCYDLCPKGSHHALLAVYKNPFITIQMLLPLKHKSAIVCQ